MQPYFDQEEIFMVPKTVDEFLSLRNGVKLACTRRVQLDDRSSALVFVHGFGSSKEFFADAFLVRSLDSFSLIALDLPGFGESPAIEGLTYSMLDFANLLFEALDILGITSFNLCVHSMGGLIGIEMARMAPDRVRSLVNLEGNLTLDDCFMTGKILESSFEYFNETGRREFEKRIERQASSDPVLSSFLLTFRRASSEALYWSARHTVKDSGDPRLIERFIALPNRCYVYGAKNKGLFLSEKKLLDAGVPVFYVENAGHAMAEENPLQLFSLIRAFICQ